MSYDKGMITKPVSIADVQKCVPVLLKRTNTSTGQVERRSSCDLGVLCSAQTGNQVTARDGKGTWVVENRVEINKWAWYKPIKYAIIGMLTEAMRKAAYYGLFFRENTDAENLLKSATPTESAFNEAASSSYEWSYLRPTGGSTSPYRLTDFVGETNNGGYKHNTKPPFEIFGDWTVELTKLNDVANTYSVVPTGSNYDQSITMYANYTNTTEIYAGNLFLGYQMKYNTQSQYDINGPDPMAIPMTSLLGAGGVNTEAGYWRVGMIVFVPGSTAHVGLFVSKKTFIASKSGVNGENVRDLSIEMCTNQELALAMYRYMSGRTEYTFRALPVLVKDVKIQQNSKQSATDIARTYIEINGNGTKIYPLPTGSVEIGIKVTNTLSGGGDEDKSTSGNFTLGTKWVASAGYEPVNVITITSTSPITKAWTAYLDIDYEDAEGTHTLLNRNCSIPAGSQFDAQGVTYNGVTLNGGVRLRITTIRKFIVS